MSYKDYEPFDLAAGDFLVGQLEGLEIDNIANAFAGYVDKVLGKINDGKEATVYLCRAGDAARNEGTATRYLAAKLYRARKFRNFENDRGYRNFGKMRDRRLAKQMRAKSTKGKRAFHRQWIESEFRTLTQLWELGVRVPRPWMHCADGILMAFVGTRHGPAPRLVNCRLGQPEAAALRDAIVADLELMITAGIVHGDLSAYNILYDGRHHTIIDLPQAMDARTTPDAYSLCQRDLANIERFFAKYDLTFPVRALMRRYF